MFEYCRAVWRRGFQKTRVWQKQRKSRYAVIPAQAGIPALGYWECLKVTAISNFRIPSFEGMAILPFSILIYYKRLSENVVLSSRTGFRRHFLLPPNPLLSPSAVGQDFLDRVAAYGVSDGIFTFPEQLAWDVLPVLR
ncbi:hypothetical protein [Neisseria meningitidis]|uniref:hypothetical protein n=1 Tax=Neisseria meningitidis TaxID=487 RepID=UPI001375A246|nr:hypothetical protein [Neisseria meningitidis]